MIAIIALIVFLVFLFLASMHIYWALGETKFAKNDSRYYSPLCLVIAILTAILTWNQPLTALCI